MIKQPKPLIGAAADTLKIVIERLPKQKEEYLADVVLQDATLMRLHAAGEYLARVRERFPDFYETHHNKDWHSLIGLRNIISHGYLQIDQEKVWATVTTDIQKLIDDLDKLF